ncbi:hypothetical protein NQ315_013958 [Exocentrus adspersus]|uniref:Uncharacterized protein n=1 Tax=Exocentrus adspersus TaxID=1586481 RepID=A0AAV8VR23_9CUCU|nr:hypothetical protein NQ315_013958 [Exocentrus adspersus]
MPVVMELPLIYPVHPVLQCVGNPGPGEETSTPAPARVCVSMGNVLNGLTVIQLIFRNMKCSALQLINRSEHNRRSKLNRKIQKNVEPVYITKGYHGYSFTFFDNNIPTTPTSKKPPVLSVSNIDLSEEVCTLNTGYSLKKWSNKLPRLKSARKNGVATENRDLESEYDMSYSFNNILDCIDDSETQEHTERCIGDEYEIHSDIEELIRRSDEIRRQENAEGEEKGRSANNARSLIDDKSRKRHKQKFKKTIKFSFSKPASPQTEQVIRVDVTSNISVDELRHIESSRTVSQSDDCSKNSAKVINECGRKELDRGFNENGIMKFDGEDEEFIIRCSQLSLTQKRR